MKTLVVIGHPDIERSVVNKKWIEELRKYPDLFTVHELARVYPDGLIDVEKEQSLIMEHGNLVLQFPIYWFNCPPLLKKWLDDVLVEGWAFGKTGIHLKDRKIALGVTAGGNREEYDSDGRYKYRLEDVLVPFEITATYCNADYQPFFAIYNADLSTEEEVQRSAAEYVGFLQSLM